jgi:putative heme transporter
MLPEKVPLNARIAFTLLNVCLGALLLYYGRALLVPLAYGLLFSLILLPVCKRLETRGGMSRVAAVSLTVTLLVISLSLLVVLLMTQFLSFTDKIPLFVERLNTLFSEIQSFCSGRFGIKLFASPGGVMDMLGSGQGFLTDTLFITTGLMINAGLVIVYTFFFLLYRSTFTQFVFHLFPDRQELGFPQFMNRIQKLIQSYILGILSVIFSIAILNSIGLSLLNIENAVFLGVIAACFAIIPYIGVFVGASIPFLVAFITKDSPWYAVGVVGMSIVVHLLEGNIITPYFVGRRVRINPLTVVVGMLVGEQLWGLSGIVLSIPVIAVLKAVFDTVDELKPYGYMLGIEISREKPDFSIFTGRLRLGKEKEVSS